MRLRVDIYVEAAGWVTGFSRLVLERRFTGDTMKLRIRTVVALAAILGVFSGSRIAVAQSQPTGRPRSFMEKSSLVKRGQTTDEVYDIMGLPDSVKHRRRASSEDKSLGIGDLNSEWYYNAPDGEPHQAIQITFANGKVTGFKRVGPKTHWAFAPPSSPSLAPDVPDQIVLVDDGRSVFRSLRFVQGSFSVFLAGTVTNETSHPWEQVVFDLRWTASDGETGRLGSVFCQSFPIGSECPLSLGHGFPGMMIQAPRKAYVISGFYLTNGHYVPNYSFSLQKPKSSEKLAFEDSTIVFVAQVFRQGIGVAILNKTDEPIKIDWNQVSFIGSAQECEQVS